MPGDTWFLGIDAGTGSCKSVVVDGEGTPLALGTGTYRGESITEQQPDALIDGMVHSVREALARADVDPAACAGVSIGGTLHSLMAVDAHGQPLTGVMTWADNRAAPQAQQAKALPHWQGLYERTGCPIHAMYPLYKLLWLKEEQPDVTARAARFVSSKEYLVHELTGEYLLDTAIAGGMGLLDTHTLTWDADALRLAGISDGQFSPLTPPRTTLPLRDNGLVAAMGLPAGIPLTLGASDAANSNLGAGAGTASTATCMIGTSGAYRIISPEPLLDEQRRLWCYTIDHDHWLVGGAINNGGAALSWLHNTLNALTAGEGLSFDDLFAIASGVPVGAEGLLCLPLFGGERSPGWNALARGSFVGLTLTHDTRHMARALLEGVAFRLRTVARALDDVAERRIVEVRASGGFTRSDVWLQIVAGVLGADLTLTEWGETSSLGAAFWAMIGAGALPSLEAAAARVQPARTQRADPTAAAGYDRIYAVYTQIYDALAPYYDELSRLANAQDAPR